MPQSFASPQRNVLALVLALAAAAGPAMAEDDDAAAGFLAPFELSGELGVVTNYIDRGITSSDNDPAIQGGLSLGLPLGEGETGIYAGIWGSTVDFDEEGDGPVELELSAGVYGSLGETGIDWDVWAAYYLYPGARGSLDYDYGELLGRLGYALTDDLSTSAGYAFSPDYSGSTGLAHYVDAGVAYTLPLELPTPVTLDATLGRQWFESNSQTGLDDYLDWSLGVTVAIGPVDLGLRYTDTDLGRSDCFGGSNACGSRVVVSLVGRF
jgi:uncharacterized protein (TIGR02001 family)